MQALIKGVTKVTHFPAVQTCRFLSVRAQLTFDNIRFVPQKRKEPCMVATRIFKPT